MQGVGAPHTLWGYLLAMPGLGPLHPYLSNIKLDITNLPNQNLEEAQINAYQNALRGNYTQANCMSTEYCIPMKLIAQWCTMLIQQFAYKYINCFNLLLALFMLNEIVT